MDLEDVLTRHFAPQAVAGASMPDLDPNAAERLLRILGVAAEDLGVDGAANLEVVRLALRLGMDEDALLAIAQAYGRAIGRIVDAESEIVRRTMREVDPAERADALDRFLHAARPLSDRLFSAVHAARLHRALSEALDPGLDEPEVPRRAIALVDYVRSTPFLRRAAPEETAAFVDRLYEVALAVTTDRRATAVKFAGDGVFFSGTDRDDVLLAAVLAVRALDEDGPLRARGGLAFGPVVRRAGDYFGFAVNFASRLTEAAEPGSVLADAGAVEQVPDDVECERRETGLRGLDGSFVCLSLR
jgi:adenylate cyclase